MKTQARAPRSAAGRASMAVLLGFGPFFAYPWKPLVNHLAGIPYAKAYRNFREQHTDSANLALHIVCLASQLAGNFGLLCALDLAVLPHLPPVFATEHADSPLGLRVFSLLTVTVWLITLLITAGAPWAARLVSAACIACAYFASPFLHPVQVELGSYALFLLAALAYSCTAISPAKCAALAAGLAAWFGAFELLCAWSGADGGEQTLGLAPHWRQASTNGPIFGEYAAQTAGAFGGLLAVAALSPRPLAPTVALGFAGSRLAYVLTGESLFWWFHFGFAATIGQKVAHVLSGEQSTLEREEAKGGDEVVKGEWAHVVFFPNLLLHAVLEQVGATPSTLGDARKPLRESAPAAS